MFHQVQKLQSEILRIKTEHLLAENAPKAQTQQTNQQDKLTVEKLAERLAQAEVTLETYKKMTANLTQQLKLKDEQLKVLREDKWAHRHTSPIQSAKTIEKISSEEEEVDKMFDDFILRQLRRPSSKQDHHREKKSKPSNKADNAADDFPGDYAAAHLRTLQKSQFFSVGNQGPSKRTGKHSNQNR